MPNFKSHAPVKDMVLVSDIEKSDKAWVKSALKNGDIGVSDGVMKILVADIGAILAPTDYLALAKDGRIYKLNSENVGRVE